MGLFGSTKTVYLKYIIYLTDAAMVAHPTDAGEDRTTRVGGVVGTGTPIALMAPLKAAVKYGAPAQLVSDAIAAPCTRSEWIISPEQLLSGHYTKNYPAFMDAFERSSGGFLGFGGTDTTYIWIGTFAFLPGPDATPIPGTPGLPMVARRWIDGFELPGVGDGGEGGAVSGAQERSSRGGSRHVSGFGLFLDNTTDGKIHSPIENGAAATASMWERFYIRIRRYPTLPSQVWRVKGAISANAGISLDCLPSGALVINNIDAGGTKSPLQPTSPLAVNVWYKLDLLYSYGQASNPGLFKLIINGTSIADLQVLQVTGGLGQVQNISQCILGGGPANLFSWNVDDWIGAAYAPAGLTFTSWLNSCDAITGSRVALVGPTGFASDNAASWAASGDWRVLRQRPNGSGNTIVLTSSVSGAVLSVTTDAAREVDEIVGANGYMGFVVGLYGLRAGAVDGSLGFRFASGGAITAVNILQSAFAGYPTPSPPTYFLSMYAPAGLIKPATGLAGLELLHTKGASVSLASAFSLMAAVELQGIFGAEDQAPATVAAGSAKLPIALGIHNAPYPHSPWALSGPPPPSPVLIKAGTYVGNGTFQDLKFRAPVHWLWIRQVTAAGAGSQWWSSMDAAHRGGLGAMYPEGAVEVLTDPAFVAGSADAGTQALPPTPPDALEAISLANTMAYGFQKYLDDSYWRATGHVYTDDPDYFFKRILGDGAQGGPDQAVYGPYAVPPSNWKSTQEQQTIVRIAGTSTSSNANGFTYQYVAFGDAGQRFLECGALGVYGGTNDFINNLNDETFTAEAVFVQPEYATNDGTIRMLYKGLGSAASAITPFSGAAEIASGLAFGLGTLTSKTGLMQSVNQIAYAAFRRNDGSADPGVPRVLQLATYVGDGTASRTIGLAPASGKRPLWAIVIPHGGAAPVFRDPSHLTTTSTLFPTTDNAATGITGAAIDSLSVGSVLNANGVTYDVFVLPGDSTAGNGGFSVNGEFVPVEMTAPTGTMFDPTPDPIEAPDTGGPGGDGGDGGLPIPGGPPTDPFGTQCVAASTMVINIALSRIGVSKRVVDIVLDQTEEAATARLHYNEDVDATLRDFPWPFATKYATLVLVGGTATVPVNGDWQYSYRTPADCLFARRIVDSTGAANTTALVGTVNRTTGSARSYQPAPIAFRAGADDVGGLIYTNQPLPELEYTKRPTCAASQGDAIFRSALAWRHAASLAPILAKDAALVTRCWQMYGIVKATAETKASDEAQQDPDGGPSWLDGR
jgi:hypothetical protein